MKIRVVDGEVVVLGPESIAFSMTVETARGACERLCALEAERRR